MLIDTNFQYEVIQQPHINRCISPEIHGTISGTQRRMAPGRLCRFVAEALTISRVTCAPRPRCSTRAARRRRPRSSVPWMGSNNGGKGKRMRFRNESRKLIGAIRIMRDISLKLVRIFPHLPCEGCWILCWWRGSSFLLLPSSFFLLPPDSSFFLAGPHLPALDRSEPRQISSASS